MRIGDLARRAGTTTRALRFYETQGLLTARRTTNGYREYDEADLTLVREIRTLQDIGFSLDDTRPFVECLRSGHHTGDACADSIEVYERKLTEIDALVDRLAQIRTDIAAKLADARSRRTGTCGSDTVTPEEN
ncbi:DNA-binding transcriptional MerR regulator [Haloactinopolyspora alba]|uniref:DNA-binding transcriptional MerR regulator n=1 Tax=Haloactinopolyspora alba TaxID=648780 RepID=A0A2P8E7J8_9ACTN|nr:MerR family transcriptional regulator [Haloactinopolyspora alba]PSL05431.1 DNA-binding transcriptional MerR regulator [Haloactinopolyspora alba]